MVGYGFATLFEFLRFLVIKECCGGIKGEKGRKRLKMQEDGGSWSLWAVSSRQYFAITFFNHRDAEISQRRRYEKV